MARELNLPPLIRPNMNGVWVCDFRDLEQYVVSGEDDRIALQYRSCQPVRERDRGNKRTGPCKCPHCSWSDCDVGLWTRHQRQHWPQQIFLCPREACRGKSRVFLERHRLVRHCQKTHKNRPFTEHEANACRIPVKDSLFPRTCDYGCPATFETFEQRLRHLPLHFVEEKVSAAASNDNSATEDSSNSSTDGRGGSSRPDEIDPPGPSSTQAQVKGSPTDLPHQQTGYGRHHSTLGYTSHSNGLRIHSATSGREVRTKPLAMNTQGPSLVSQSYLPTSESHEEPRNAASLTRQALGNASTVTSYRSISLKPAFAFRLGIPGTPRMQASDSLSSPMLQRYLADGVHENLTERLFCGLPRIFQIKVIEAVLSQIIDSGLTLGHAHRAFDHSNEPTERLDRFVGLD